MTERTLTTGLMQYLAVAYPKAVVLKHSDRFTVGIPDLSVSVNGATTWFEVKYVRVGSSLRSEITTLQVLLGTQIQRATAGRCWVLAYYEKPREVRLVVPGRFLIMDKTDPTPAHVAPGFDHSIVRKVLDAAA